MDLNAKKKKALDLMAAQRQTVMPKEMPPSDEGPVLNETGAGPAASRFTKAIAKRRSMKGIQPKPAM